MTMANRLSFDEWENGTLLFGELKKALADDSNGISSIVDFNQLESVFRYNYSYVLLNRKATLSTINDVVSNIVFKYGKKWDITHDLMYNRIRAGVSSYRTMSNTESIETTKDIVKELTRNVGTFNSDNLVNDMSDDDTIEELLKNAMESNREEETYTMFAIQQHLSIIRNSFNDMLMKDIASEILLLIY